MDKLEHMDLKDEKKAPNPLKSRLNSAISHVELLVDKLNQAEEKFYQRYKVTFTKITDAYAKHSSTCAYIFAYELVEIRKVIELIINSKITLEQIVIWLRKRTEIDDCASSLGPALVALQTVKSKLANVFPETENDLNEINRIIADADPSLEKTLNLDNAKETADKILSESTSIAKQRIKEKFPDIEPKIPEHLQHNQINQTSNSIMILKKLNSQNEHPQNTVLLIDMADFMSGYNKHT
jgi:division protein CdvB (Snf7/Vps24/ESCRT-III family)